MRCSPARLLSLLTIVGLGACNTGGDAGVDASIDTADSTVAAATVKPPAPATVGGLAMEAYTTPVIRGWKATMQKPVDMQAFITNGGLELKYIGPDALPETEIMDGIYASIMPAQVPDRDRADETIRASDLVGEITDVTINGTPAKRYKSADAMGGDDNTNHLFLLDEYVLINVTYVSFGSRAPEYDRAMESMVESIEWERQ